MGDQEQVLQLKTHAGETVTVNGLAITPQSQALSLRWPYGGFVWNRPVGVVVEQDGEAEHIPIVDITLLVQVALFGLAVVFSVATLMLSVVRRRA